MGTIQNLLWVVAELLDEGSSISLREAVSIVTSDRKRTSRTEAPAQNPRAATQSLSRRSEQVAGRKRATAQLCPQENHLSPSLSGNVSHRSSTPSASKSSFSPPVILGCVAKQSPRVVAQTSFTPPAPQVSFTPVFQHASYTPPSTQVSYAPSHMQLSWAPRVACDQLPQQVVRSKLSDTYAREGSARRRLNSARRNFGGA